jgi:ABC-2 type transport system permease protein
MARDSKLQVALEYVGGALALAHRELLSLFVTPLAYVVGTLFLLQQGYNFALLLRVLNDPLAAPGPVMQYYFGGSFFIFWLPVVFLCAAISMRLIAEERKQGTLEALMTAPLWPSQVAIGKLLGALSFYAALWLPTITFYVLLRGAAVEPDPGPIVAGYLGTLIVGASFLGIGLVSSAVTRSQLGAAIGTFVACTIVLLAGLLVDQVEQETLSAVLARTSLLSMMQELSQGIVDGRWLWLHGGVVVVTVALASVLIDPRRDLERFVRVGLLAVAVGHIAWLGMRHADREDWTGGRVYSLSERAASVLTDLDKPVDVTVLVPQTIGGGRPNPLAGELREVLTRMRAATPMLRVRMIDPDRDRQDAETLIAEFGLGGRDLADGVVLVRAGQGADLRKTHRLPGDLVTYATGADVQMTGPRVKEFRGEEALLSAFLEVTDPVQTTICVTEGHGEPALDNLEPFAGYAHLADLLRRSSLTVQAADLQTPGALDVCDVVLVAGPRGAWPKAHVDALARYAEAGGDLLVLSGAVILPGTDRLVQHGFEPLLASYGIELRDRVVLDPHPMPGGAPLLAFTLVEGWADHPAVRSLVGRPVSFVVVREMVLAGSPDAVPPEPLFVAPETAWAESDIAAIRSGGEVGFDADVDVQGPIPIAAAGQRGGSRLVVIASDQFAFNAYFREDVAYDHGRDLVLNSVGWLTERRSLLGIRARSREHVKLVLLDEQLSRMIWVCLAGLPGFAIALGFWVLWRRRR